MARILLIDDERLICDMLRTVFTQRKHEVFTALEGGEGLALFAAQRPDVTLLDLRMPELNGIEVLREIRKIDPLAAVMVLTGWGSDDMEGEARALGVSDFVCKGLSLEMLVSAVDRVLHRPKSPKRLPASPLASNAPPTPASDTTTESPATTAMKRGRLGKSIFWREASHIRVLIVDDEPEIRRLLEQFLTLRDYYVLTASDALTGLSLVEQEHPDCLVIDLYMPGMNGVELLRELRNRNYKGGIVVLSACRDEILLQEALLLGPVDVLGKPVDLERLVLAIKVRTLQSGSAATPHRAV